jgi:hypothetical protein
LPLSRNKEEEEEEESKKHSSDVQWVFKIPYKVDRGDSTIKANTNRKHFSVSMKMKLRLGGQPQCKIRTFNRVIL